MLLGLAHPTVSAAAPLHKPFIDTCQEESASGVILKPLSEVQGLP